jgi:hypothetical protein
MGLGEGWSHVVRGDELSRATLILLPNTPQPITEAHKQPRVTATTKKAKTEKAEPKTTTAPEGASVKLKKAATTGAKSVAAAPPVAKPHPNSPLEGISDLADNLPLEACVELTLWLLTSMAWHSSLLGTGPVPHPVGGNCHSSCAGR